MSNRYEEPFPDGLVHTSSNDESQWQFHRLDIILNGECETEFCCTIFLWQLIVSWSWVERCKLLIGYGEGRRTVRPGVRDDEAY